MFLKLTFIINFQFLDKNDNYPLVGFLWQKFEGLAIDLTLTNLTSLHETTRRYFRWPGKHEHTSFKTIIILSIRHNAE